MAHTDPMTWRPKDRRWTKYYNGKHYYVSYRQLLKAGLLDRGTPNTKDGTRPAMRTWWKQKESELLAACETVREPELPKGIYISGVGVGYDAEGKSNRQFQLHIARKIQPGDVGLAEHIENLISNARTQADRLYKAAEVAPPEKAIGTHIAALVAHKKAQADAGERSRDRAESLRVHLDHFQRFFGEGRPIIEIVESTVQEYYQHVLGEAKAARYSRHYARDLFAAFRQFTRWLAGRRLIPLPLNISSKDFGFSLKTTIKTFSEEEIKLLLDKAADRTKLFLLLGLNLGFTQGEIAELPKSRVDLVKNTVTHKRFKTEHHETVPTVVFPLWDETARLLKINLNRDDSLVNRHGEPLAIVSTSGRPLVWKDYDEKGRLKKTDAVRNAFNRLVLALKNEGTPVSGSFKHLRKTAASKLEEHSTFGRFAPHFLGHSPQSVAAKHYVTPSPTQFAAAIRWLEGKLFR